MKSVVFSLLLIALCIMAILILPPLRAETQTLITVIQRGRLAPSQAELEQAARQLPSNPAVAVALAQYAMGQTIKEMEPPDQPGPPALPADLSLFRKAAQDFPEAPETHLHLAIQFLQRAGSFQWPESWMGVGITSRPRPLPRSEEQANNLEEAVAQLREAAARAPENAAPYYLLALALSAKGDEAGAKASLNAALRRQEWSLYTKEIRRALAELCRQAQVPEVHRPLFVQNVSPEVSSGIYQQLEALGRLLAGRQNRARAAGNTPEALYYSQALLHLNQLLLEGADSVSDGQVAAGIAFFAREPFLSREQIAQLRQQNGEKADAQIAELQGRKLQDYLIASGEKNLAELYNSNWRRILAFQKASAKTWEESAKEMAQFFTAPVVFFALIGLAQTAALLLLLVLTLLLSVLFIGGRGSGPAPVWRWWQGGLLFLLFIGLSYLAVALTLPAGEATFTALAQTRVSPAQFLAIRGIFIAPLLFMAASLIWGICKRPLAEKERIGKFHAGLSSWRTLLLPALAISLTATLGFGYFAQKHLQPWIAAQNQIVEQGAVSYYHLIPPQ